jgi:hypothetical protein
MRWGSGSRAPPGQSATSTTAPVLHWIGKKLDVRRTCGDSRAPRAVCHAAADAGHRRNTLHDTVNRRRRDAAVSGRRGGATLATETDIAWRACVSRGGRRMHFLEDRHALVQPARRRRPASRRCDAADFAPRSAAAAAEIGMGDRANSAATLRLRPRRDAGSLRAMCLVQSDGWRREPLDDVIRVGGDAALPWRGTGLAARRAPRRCG